jgi:hypothetical protein
VVFTATLNHAMEVAAVEGSYASLIDGAPAAAVFFAGEVNKRTAADPPLTGLEARIDRPGRRATRPRRPGWPASSRSCGPRCAPRSSGEVAAELDGTHSIERAQRVGSVHQIVPAVRLRPYLVDAVWRGMAKFDVRDQQEAQAWSSRGWRSWPVGRGIGAAITRALARSGVHVAAGYSWNRGATDDLPSKLTAESCSVSVHQGNVGKSEDCQRVVSEVLEAKRRVDHLVNNAGIAVDKTMRKMTVEDWHAVLRINLSGAFYITKIVLDVIGNGCGRIVNISSAVGQMGQHQAAGPTWADAPRIHHWALSEL